MPENSTDTVLINGKMPTKIIPATPQNLKKHKITESEAEIKVS